MSHSKLFQVWAPLPRLVELLWNGRRHPMQRRSNDWWIVEVESGHGTDYGFMLDGEGPFPDPRSSWQPQGVHALSRVVDHHTFRWTDDAFNAPPLSQAIIYELHIGTFTPQGTFEAAIEKLDRLVNLGITHVQLMPVSEFSGLHGWGYDGVDLYAPHHVYGGPEGLKKLVNACHMRGLAVLLDVVYNHLGPSGNYLAKYGPYFSERYHTPWGWAVNFDGPRSAEVRRFFCDNAQMWLRDYHLDGLRLDAVHAIFDISAKPFLEQLSEEVKTLSQQLGRHLVVIAESDLNDPKLVRQQALGGFGLDAQWSDDFHHALHSVLTGERSGYYEDFGSISDLAKAWSKAFVYDGRYSVHRQRHHGRTPVGLDGHHFLGYAQTHDQVGNRARGERLCHLVSLGRQKIAAALVLTSPFVPMLFQGEEWAASTPFQYFTDHPEASLAKAVSEGRRKEFAAFGWKPEDVPDPQARETLQHSKLLWSELAQVPHTTMLDWYRQLINLRRNEPVLTDGRLNEIKTHFDERACWLVVERPPIGLVCNLANCRQRIPLSSGSYKTLLASEAGIQETAGYVELPADSVVILKSGT